MLLQIAKLGVRFTIYTPELLPDGTGISLHRQLQKAFEKDSGIERDQIPQIIVVPDVSAKFYIKKCVALFFCPIIVLPTGDCIVNAGVPLFVQLAVQSKVPTYGVCRRIQFSFKKYNSIQCYDHPAKLLPPGSQLDDFGDVDVISLIFDEINEKFVKAYICDAGTIEAQLVFRYLNEWKYKN